MKKFQVVRKYSEFEKAIKDKDCCEVIVVIRVERDRQSLYDVISESRGGEEIIIDSIASVFSSPTEIKEVVDLALNKNIVIRTVDGSFSTEDFEDVPVMAYLLNSIIEITNYQEKSNKKYPSRFLEVVERYMDRNISEIEATNILNIQRAHFYRLLRDFGASRRKVNNWGNVSILLSYGYKKISL